MNDGKKGLLDPYALWGADGVQVIAGGAPRLGMMCAFILGIDRYGDNMGAELCTGMPNMPKGPSGGIDMPV